MAWTNTTLGDVIELFDNKRVPLNSRQRAERQGPYPYYGAQGIIDWVDDFRYDGRFLLVPEDGENLRSRKLPIAFFATGRFWVNNHAHVLRGREGVADDDFLKHWLNNADIGGFVTGAAQPKLSQDGLRRIPITIPTLALQRRIASILSAYDDLIENNTRRIAILEEMARRLYEEWFVRFRFPGHEQVKMVESELGLIPKDWGPTSVGRCVTVHRGKSYKGTELVDDGGLPFVNLKCMERDGGFRKAGLKRYTGAYKETHQVVTGDLVMAVTDMTQERRIVARCGRVPRLGADFGVISMDLVKIEANKGVPKDYMYGMFRWSGFADEVKQHANGANVLHLLPDRISDYRFALPPATLMQQFADLVGPMLRQGDVLTEKNEALRTTRDLLLPKLISGELDVSTLPEPEAIAA